MSRVPTIRRAAATPRRPVVAAGPRLAARAKAERLERRNTLLRRTAWASAGLAPLMLLGWLLLSSPILAVRNVSVVGVHRLGVADVRAAAAVGIGTPLARLDTGAVAARVEALDPVASVTVTRAWPHGVRLTVVERVAVVAVRRGTGLVLLDASGHDVARVDSLPRGVLRLKVDHPGVDDPSTKAALAVLHALPTALRGQLASLRASSPEQVELMLRGDRKVVWGGTDGAASKVAAVLALIKLPGHVYDVSAPGVVTRR